MAQLSICAIALFDNLAASARSSCFRIPLAALILLMFSASILSILLIFSKTCQCPISRCNLKYSRSAIFLLT